MLWFKDLITTAMFMTFVASSFVLSDVGAALFAPS